MSGRIVREAHVRAASLRDVEHLLPLMQAYWAFEQAEGFELWVAEAQGQLVAYVVLAYVYSCEYGGRMAEFDELYVVEE